MPSDPKNVSRGEFLRSLGKSLPGYAIGSAATLAGKLLNSIDENKKPASPVTKEPATEVKFITNGPATCGRKIALTFDDGPVAGVTDRILDELKQRQLVASFFMIGERVAAEPDLARRVVAEGHEVCNHSFTHPKLTTLPDAQVEAELKKTQDIIAEVLQREPIWFRPPFGEFRKNQAPLARRQKLDVVIWSVEARDWEATDPALVSQRILEKAAPGAIILLHDAFPVTPLAIGTILDGLLERSLELTTLTKLIKV